MQEVKLDEALIQKRFSKVLFKCTACSFIVISILVFLINVSNPESNNDVNTQHFLEDVQLLNKQIQITLTILLLICSIKINLDIIRN
jgi:hypothetical protein